MDGVREGMIVRIRQIIRELDKKLALQDEVKEKRDIGEKPIYKMRKV